VDSAIDPLSGRFIKASQAAAEALGISARPLEASTSDAIEQVILRRLLRTARMGDYWARFKVFH